MGRHRQFRRQQRDRLRCRKRYLQAEWAAKVPLAHGAAIIGHDVFVSSLDLRKIFVLDLANGKAMGSFGEPGWNAHCLNFLWPTSLYAADERTIVITDAHTGGLYRLDFDGETIRLIDVVGGTVPVRPVCKCRTAPPESAAIWRSRRRFLRRS